ncbi:MuDR family transposase [Artemisia annua]|uniref:MuDR family transposase n=1 Tax=Artemisia annua TaxID=35608 RepID=A0A2U1LBM7_ARTAN|nr:MuDR family transposase [Artemisia annua]
MAQKFVTLVCYWGGEICDGPEGVAYNNFPKKAIKVRCGVKYNEFIDQVQIATSIDKLRSRINVICRYPTVVGKVMRYVPLPIADDNDVEIMFDVFSLHQELSSIDVYLEVQINGPGLNEEIAVRTQEPVLSANEASLPTMKHANVVSDMNQNQGFNTISQIAVVNNETTNGFDTHDIAFVDDGLEGDEVDNDIQVTSPSTNTEGVDMATADNWMSRSKKGKNDLTRELGKEIFKDKEELIRDIKLYTIQKRKQYEVVEARGKGRPRSTSLGNGMDVNGEKLANLCGICRQRGHNRKTCPSKPSEEPTDP